MADFVIHLSRTMEAYQRNARSPIALRTVTDGALRPTTDRQRFDAATLVRFASKESANNNKELHQRKIRDHFESIVRKNNAVVDVNWTEGVFNIRNAKVNTIE